MADFPHGPLETGQTDALHWPEEEFNLCKQITVTLMAETQACRNLYFPSYILLFKC